MHTNLAMGTLLRCSFQSCRCGVALRLAFLTGPLGCCSVDHTRTDKALLGTGIVITAPFYRVGN